MGVGLSAFEPPLEELRSALAAAGGGTLELRPDYRDRSLCLSVARLGRGAGSRRSALELAYVRYLGRAAAGDFRLEIERWGGSFLGQTRQDRQSRLQTSYGVGPVLFRLRREGQVRERAAAPATRTDWVWGLGSLAAAEAFLSARMSLGARYSYDLVRTASLDGLDYSLDGGTFSFHLTWYSP